MRTVTKTRCHYLPVLFFALCILLPKNGHGSFTPFPTDTPTPTFTPQTTPPARLWQDHAWPAQGYVLFIGDEIYFEIDTDVGRNWFMYSEEFDQEVWLDPEDRTVITPNAALAPNGSTTAEVIDWTSVGVGLRQIVQRPDFMTGQQYTVSLYMRKVSGNNTLRVACRGGPPVDKQASSKWKRCAFVCTAGTADTNSIDFSVAGTTGKFEIWGAQVVAGTSMKHYSKTTSVQHFHPRVFWKRHGGDHFGWVISRAQGESDFEEITPTPILANADGTPITPIPWETSGEQYWSFPVGEEIEQSGSRYYWKISALNAESTPVGSVDDYGVTYLLPYWKGGLEFATPTPTIRLWENYLYGSGGPPTGSDVDQIANNKRYRVCWGPHLPRYLDMTVDRKEGESGEFTAINPSVKWRDCEYGGFYGEYWFQEAPLPGGTYYYRALLNGTPVADGDGIQVVTPCHSDTPTPTPSFVNMLRNPKLGYRLVNGVAVHWARFTWQSGCGLPPTGSSTGLGISPDYGRSYDDAPAGGGRWSQTIFGPGAFCGGVYQQVRVIPGFEYRVSTCLRIAEGNSDTAVGIGVALDGSTLPNSAETWQWDKKTSATDPGNWGSRGDIGSGWIDRQYVVGTARPVADTMTVFLFAQSTGGSATVLFNNVAVEMVTQGVPTPTPAPRSCNPVFVIEHTGSPIMAVSAWGDLVANSVSELASFPQEIGDKLWSVYEGTNGAWLEDSGEFAMTGTMVSCLPEEAARLLTLRAGWRGQIVFAVTGDGDVYCRRGFFQTTGDDDSDTISNLDEAILYGTDPMASDSDGDGVSDYTELFGGGQEAPNLRIHQWGTDPLHKDFWLELDWMATPEPPATPRPPSEPHENMLQSVADVFSNGPVANPDGLEGVTLHIDAGPSWSVNFDPNDPDDYGGGSTVPYKERASSYDIENPAPGDDWIDIYFKDRDDRKDLFRYGVIIYAHAAPASGDADCCPGQYFVAVYFENAVDWMTTVITHEYGHNLGLGHGGDNMWNHKPNYNSLMNYRFNGSNDIDCDAIGDGVRDFSIGDRLPLDESQLYEPEGVCGCDWSGIDWNGGGSVEQITYEHLLLQEYCDLGPLMHEDFNDWELMQPVLSTGFGPGLSKTSPPESEVIICDFGGEQPE